jgi:UDP-GlcNAc:undecaprenyl-phosphate GlcNAc-1-phosphate transferase
MEVRLQGAGDWSELWDALTGVGRTLNLLAIRLDVNAPALHEGYHARWDRADEEGEEAARWRAEIPLRAGNQTVGRLEVAGLRDGEPVWMKITTLCLILEKFEAGVNDFAGPESDATADRRRRACAPRVLAAPSPRECEVRRAAPGAGI